MSNENSESQRLQTAQEIDTFLKALSSQSTEISLSTDTDNHYRASVVRVEASRVFIQLEKSAAKPLRLGEIIQVVVGLKEGLFTLKTQVTGFDKEQVFFDIGKEIFRLQRRNDFRTPVPVETKIKLKITHIRGTQLSTPIGLQLVDLSAGGVSALWRDHEAHQLANGHEVSGVLTLPDNKEIKFKSDIRSIAGAHPSASVFGLRFLGLSLQDSQSLIFACVQLSRKYQVLFV